MTAGVGDLTVVIPTRDRWTTLARTLAALAGQTCSGFEVVVAVDGLDQDVPAALTEGRVPGSLPVRVVRREAGGAAAARNAGVAGSERPLLLLLDDDMIPRPDLVARHLAWHRRHPEPEVGVLGHVDWHPELGGDRISRWLDWSGTMFEHHSLADRAGQDVGWGRFYSCNVSLKRSLFESVGGFDEAFWQYYEDTDLGLRLGAQGLRLVYEPAAVTLHHQSFDWPAVRRRFEKIAVTERLMVTKHPHFAAWFHNRLQAARAGPVPSRLWPLLVDWVPPRPRRLRRLAEERADRWYQRQLAPSFLAAWDRAADLCDLYRYLGDRYQPRLLLHHAAEIDKEAERAGDEAAFYRTSEVYLYDLTVFAMSGTKDPYRAELRALVPPGGRILDYGCGIGADGLRLLDAGYDVHFADFESPSTRFLRWRLEQRSSAARVYDLDRDEVPGGFDAAYAFDVIEHVDDPVAFLAELEQRAAIVMVNLLEPDPHDTHLHRALPIADILAHARARGLLSYQVHHGRSHLLAYRSGAATGAPGTSAHAGSDRG